jgi:hypothetical protein
VSESTGLDDQKRNLDFRLKPNTVPRHLSVKVVGSPDCTARCSRREASFVVRADARSIVTMKAVRLRECNALVYKDVPNPELSPGEVFVLTRRRLQDVSD